MRIAFDIGGVLSKYPDIFRPLIELILAHEARAQYPGVEVFILSDMKPHAKAVAFCHDNGFDVPPERIICCDYQKHGEACKAVECDDLKIDLLIDDFPGYVATAGRPCVRLLVMPDPELPYYHDSFRTDGSEGDFGRRRLRTASPVEATQE